MSGFSNWTYSDVVRFLRARGFELKRTHGSHHFYAGVVLGENRIVTVAFHGARTIDIRDMNSIVRQSRIPKEEWLKA